MRTSQLELFDAGRARATTTFQENLSLPVHRWFRFSAGFSAKWVAELVRSSKLRRPTRVLDPFVGSGTAVVAAECEGGKAMGIEAHPFIARVARAKLAWREDPTSFRATAHTVLHRARKQDGTTSSYPALIAKCFPADTLVELDALRKSWQANQDETPLSELCWLALAAILRGCSPVGTAQWQYVLPRKTKSKPANPFDAFALQVEMMARDMAVLQNDSGGPRGTIVCGDARDCPGVPENWADLVVTSPPYANNYDYADATRLEMCFFGEIQCWGDLQAAVRKYLVRSCTQHVAPYANRTAALLRSVELEPVAQGLSEVVAQLESERDRHGGKKPYHAMIAHYFFDLARVWHSLRRVSKPGANVCFVVGDSAPYGVYVPVQKWLGELALAAGFKSFSFQKLRDRNTKWKNRKHRVPL